MNMCYNTNDLYLGSYLAGLFEGDGHIAIKDKRLKSPKPTFHITFHKKDLPLAKKLHDLIRSRANHDVGSVYVHKSHHSCVLKIYSVPGLITVVSLIKSHFKTPKAQSINLIIDWLNIRQNTQLNRIIRCVKPVSKSAWLTGFTDADGCFSIDLRRTPRFKLSCAWQLNQRQISATSESYESCLNTIVEFLCVPQLYLIKPRLGKSYYAIKASSAKSKQILRRYYTQWPLLSSKRCDYLTWCRVDDMIVNHHAAGRVDQIDKLKRNMNSKR